MKQLQKQKSQVLQELRGKIAGIERTTVCARDAMRRAFDAPENGVGVGGPDRSVAPSDALKVGVPFGVGEIDGALAEGGLSHRGLHEVRAPRYRDLPAAQSFLLALMARRQSFSALRGPVMWCVERGSGWDFGMPYGHGLVGLGLDPAEFVFAEPARQADAMWIMEEALRSGAVSAVVGVVRGSSGVQARRLSLASQEMGTPCFVMTHCKAAGVPVAHTRWAVRALAAGTRGAARSGGEIGEAFVPRWSVALERARHGVGSASAYGSSSVTGSVFGPFGVSWNLEWCHATRCFDLVAPLVDSKVASPPHDGQQADVVRLSA